MQTTFRKSKRRSGPDEKLKLSGGTTLTAEPGVAPGWSVSNGSGGGGGASASASVYVDANAGSNSTGQRGNSGAPYGTLSAAKAAAQSGDCIIVLPGNYTDHDLLKAGVNWYFYAGAVVSYTNGLTGVAYGIFDDRSSGAVTCSIDGDVVLHYAPTVGGSGIGNTNERGALVLTNANSNVQFRGKRIEIDNYNTTPSQGNAAVYVTGPVYVTIEVDELLEYNYGGTHTNPDDPDFPLSSFAMGVYWEGPGDLYIQCRHQKFTNYGIWGSGANAGNLWYTGDQFEGNAYMNGSNTNLRTWIDVKQFGLAGVGVSAIGYYSGGKHYLRAEKLTHDANCLYVQSNARAWVNVQKMTASAGNWIVLDTVDGTKNPVLYAEVLEFEDTGTVTIGIRTGLNGSNGALFLQGHTMIVLNGVGISHAGGTADIFGLKINTSGTNAAANYPALVSGTGLRLKQCVLLAPAASECVHSAAAQTITNYGSVANKAKSGNITVNVAAITVDANVA